MGENGEVVREYRFKHCCFISQCSQAAFTNLHIPGYVKCILRSRCRVLKLWPMGVLSLKKMVLTLLLQIMKILNLRITGCSMHLPSMQYFKKTYATWKIADLWKDFLKNNQLLRMKSECWTLKEPASTIVRENFFYMMEQLFFLCTWPKFFLSAVKYKISSSFSFHFVCPVLLFLRANIVNSFCFCLNFYVL